MGQSSRRILLLVLTCVAAQQQEEPAVLNKCCAQGQTYNLLSSRCVDDPPEHLYSYQETVQPVFLSQVRSIIIPYVFSTTVFT